MKHLQFPLPCKPYIKKFLSFLYGDPAVINLNTDHGFFIISALSSTMEPKVTRLYLDLSNKRYNDRITLYIPHHFSTNIKTNPSELTSALINRYLENEFDKMLHEFVKNNWQRDTKIKFIIEKFAVRIGLEPDADITIENLLMMEWRYFKKNKKLLEQVA